MTARPDEIVRVTTDTGGEVFKPDDAEGLTRIFTAIDAMQRRALRKEPPGGHRPLPAVGARGVVVDEPLSGDGLRREVHAVVIPELHPFFAEGVAAVVLVLAVVAEGWHARRVGRLAHLAFGPSRRPRPGAGGTGAAHAGGWSRSRGA